MEIQATTYGSLVSKANSRRITRTGRVIKSQRALDYTESAIMQLRALYGRRKPLEQPVGLDMTIFYDSRRPDLSPELFFDCLEKSGILKNDRLITEYYCRKELDKKNPRIEWCLYTLNNE